MKYNVKRSVVIALKPSLPVRGAWVEIRKHRRDDNAKDVSLPVRGAWVEIRLVCPSPAVEAVAPRAGSVG